MQLGHQRGNIKIACWDRSHGQCTPRQGTPWLVPPQAGYPLAGNPPGRVPPAGYPASGVPPSRAPPGGVPLHSRGNQWR